MNRYYKLKLFEFSSRIIFAFILFPFMASLFKLNEPPYMQYVNQALGLLYYAAIALFIPNQIRGIAKSENYLKALPGKIGWLKWFLLIVAALTFITSMFLVDVDFQTAHGAGIEKKLNYYVMVGHKLIPPNIGFLLITFLTFYLAKVMQVAEDMKEEQELTI